VKIRTLLSAAVLACVVAAPAVAQTMSATPMAAQPAATLYKRLGGYDALAAVTDDFLTRLVGEPQFARFFGGHSTDSLKKIRQLIVDQLCAATGGPCVYVGRDMKATHGGLGITEKDWDVTVKHLVATLDKFNVPPLEKDEVLSALGPLKKDIVEKP
jgi:hemoglobin